MALPISRLFLDIIKRTLLISLQVVKWRDVKQLKFSIIDNKISYFQAKGFKTGRKSFKEKKEAFYKI